MNIRRSLAWSFSQEGIEKVIRFAGSIAIARLLTPDEVGVFSIAMAANFLLNSFRDFGVNAYLIREPELTHDKVRTVFGISLVIQWSLALVVLVLREPVSGLYGEPGISEVLLVVALTFAIGPVGGPAQSLLRRDMRFDLLHHIGAAGVIAGTAVSITLAAYGFSYMALAWGMLCGNIVRTCLTLSVRRDHLTLLPSFRHWRSVLQFGGWITVAGLCGTLAMEARKFILGGLVNPAAVALFERSEQIPFMARQSLFMPIGRVLLPNFSKEIREGRPIGEKVRMLIACTTGIIWPAFLIIGFLSVPITVLLFGDSWRESGRILPYVLTAAAFLTFMPQPGHILTPLGRVKRLAKVRAIQAVVFIVLSGIGAQQSLTVFAMLQVPAYFIFVIVIYFAIKDFLDVQSWDLLQAYIKSGLLALVSALPAFSVYITWGTSIGAGQIALALVVGAIFWLLGILVFNHALKGEVLAILNTIAEKATFRLKRHP